MTHDRRHASAGPRVRRWLLATLVLAVAATAFLVLRLHGDESTADPTPSAVAPRTTTPTVTPPSATASPVDVSIPTIGVDSRLIGLGLRPDRTVEVPTDPDEAGWYRLGPVPGDPGSAVILGHVDSEHGPAVFARLARLEAGDEVSVSLDDGSLARFRVTRVATYANQNFPAEVVYAGSTTERTLNLVTCGGTYDRAAGGYQSNVVVYTEHVSTTPAA